MQGTFARPTYHKLMMHHTKSPIKEQKKKTKAQKIHKNYALDKNKIQLYNMKKLENLLFQIVTWYLALSLIETDDATENENYMTMRGKNMAGQSK